MKGDTKANLAIALGIGLVFYEAKKLFSPSGSLSKKQFPPSIAKLTKSEIFEQLEMLGFPSMANSLRTQNPMMSQKRFYVKDLQRARIENTKEEFPTSEYKRVKKLLDKYFELSKNDE